MPPGLWVTFPVQCTRLRVFRLITWFSSSSSPLTRSDHPHQECLLPTTAIFITLPFTPSTLIHVMHHLLSPSSLLPDDLRSPTNMPTHPNETLDDQDNALIPNPHKPMTRTPNVPPFKQQLFRTSLIRTPTLPACNHPSQSSNHLIIPFNPLRAHELRDPTHPIHLEVGFWHSS